jgi:DNA adenine methylase
MLKYASPLRYPGGKAALTSFLAVTIDLNELRGCAYYEPYAGGAGATLGLLKQGVVSELHLNDADQRVHAFWHSALNVSDRFVDRISTVPLTIKEWHRQHDICSNPRAFSRFDVGFAAFFMNRCNRSGVLTGAGPIGGYAQAGAWRMDVRFNRTALAERILHLGRLKDRIHLSCEDAIVFLKRSLPRGHARAKVFVYLDPPYVIKGQRLYLNAYGPRDHAALARFLRAQKSLPWLVSYDDNELVRKLYASHKLAMMPIMYTLQEKRAAQELIITPRHVAVPRSCRIWGEDRLLEAPDKTRKSP